MGLGLVGLVYIGSYPSKVETKTYVRNKNSKPLQGCATHIRETASIQNSFFFAYRTGLPSKEGMTYTPPPPNGDV